MQWYTPFGVRVHTSLGVRVHTPFGAEVLPRSVQGYCPARIRGSDPLGSGVAIRSDQRYESAFKQLHISPTFAPQTRIKTRLGFQRAGRTTRFERGEQLARVCTANAHKNIGDKTPSPLTRLGFQRAKPFGRARRTG